MTSPETLQLMAKIKAYEDGKRALLSMNLDSDILAEALSELHQKYYGQQSDNNPSSPSADTEISSQK